ncbi:HNH endonuclease [Gordonia alkanivorans]|uniref:HNH endonuclease n=1 Tax=Gordonia alkanivorans TaxID=84096 RepID=UPI0024473858|nr:HNH endonuclease [Gordonia alkanivorans]MDH3010073.1 HNH endonuclease [Gordonia alkanivorans]
MEGVLFSAVETRLREAIMVALAEQVVERGFVTRAELTALRVGTETRRIIDRSRGIWNPRDMEATLSVVSSPDSGYSDSDLGDLFRYDYRAGSSDGDNKKLRRAYELGVPIILLRKIRDGVYVPVFPTYVVGDDFEARQFVLAVDEGLRFLSDPLNPSPVERAYAERVTRQRLHQAEFRGRVLRAYETSCAVCNLEYGRLLDAAHITPDSDVRGLPIVNNGISLCKIHHSAFDSNLIGISPDYAVHVAHDVLEVVDGPMLKHGIQEMDGRRLRLPSHRSEYPDRERLAQRFDQFIAAS